MEQATERFVETYRPGLEEPADCDTGLLMRLLVDGALARVDFRFMNGPASMATPWRVPCFATRCWKLETGDVRFLLSANTARGGFQPSTPYTWNCEIGSVEARTVIEFPELDGRGNATEGPSILVSWAQVRKTHGPFRFDLTDVESASDALALCILDWHAWAVRHARRKERHDWLIALGH